MPETLTRDVSSREYHVNALARVSPCQIPAIVWPREFFNFSLGRARSNAIESSCLPIQPNRVKAQNFHLRFSILSLHHDNKCCTRHH